MRPFRVFQKCRCLISMMVFTIFSMIILVIIHNYFNDFLCLVKLCIKVSSFSMETFFETKLDKKHQTGVWLRKDDFDQVAHRLVPTQQGPNPVGRTRAVAVWETRGLRTRSFRPNKNRAEGVATFVDVLVFLGVFFLFGLHHNQLFKQWNEDDEESLRWWLFRSSWKSLGYE